MINTPDGDSVANTSQESEIIQHLKSGDKDAFVSLAKIYRDRIGSLAYTFGVNESQRDDLLQEGYITLYYAALSYNKDMSSFSTYATVCIRNRMLNWVIKNVNRVAESLSLSDMDEYSLAKLNAVENDFEDTVILKEEVSDLMKQAKIKLSAHEYEVFDLFAKGYSNPEICDAMGVDRKSCENTLFRIRTKLKALKK
ncbi:MAG: sigma-70 family RNA polymerase sigma factor [Clostridia bacterium]|nr:sigma-70 family RNA polymerase sigma factor [Clostridia bacterium]